MGTQKPLAKCLAIFVVLFGVFACVPLRSGAHAPATAITIVNNSSREIRHVYLSPPNQDNWGPDQLNGAVISAGGGSYTLGNVSCDQGSVKVITEDQNGCFLYNVVVCAESATWTITNDAVPDCGN
jgi:hypothetical protein